MSYSPAPSSGVPVGSIVAYAGASAPTGWALCDGTALDRTTYAALFSAIGTAYGAGNTTTTFNLPNLQQRFPLGKAASGTGSALGGAGGAIGHTHAFTGTQTTGSHTHGINSGSHTHSVTMSGLSASTTGSHSHTLNAADDSVFVRSASSGTLYTLATSTHAHTAFSTGDHSHVISGSGSADASSGTLTSNSANVSITPQGTNATSDPPYLVVNYIIKT